MEEPRDPTQGPRRVRNLAYLASSENDQIFKWKAEYVRCATCVITRGVSSIRVFYKALGRASDETGIYRHATLLFCAKSANVQTTGAGRKVNGYDKLVWVRHGNVCK